MLRACLAVVLMSCAVAPVLAQNGRADASANCATDTATRNAGTSTTSQQDKSAGASNYGRSATPATSQGGGGEDDTVMRLRVPKWNSFLPGMFR